MPDSAQPEKLIKLLKTHGYSLTKPRLTLFEALNAADDALTIAEIIKLAPDIDVASVYRTLDLFEKIGVAQRVWTGFKSKIELSEAFSPHHHHFVCVVCGMSETIESLALERSLLQLERSHGFKLKQHSVELSGYCKNCKAKS